MMPYQQRMIAECDELDAKFQKLSAFIFNEGTTYESLPVKEKLLLVKQRDAMLQYYEALKERIASFNTP